MVISSHIFFFTEQATVIDPADVGALETALDQNNVRVERVIGFPFEFLTLVSL